MSFWTARCASVLAPSLRNVMSTGRSAALRIPWISSCTLSDGCDHFLKSDREMFRNVSRRTGAFATSTLPSDSPDSIFRSVLMPNAPGMSDVAYRLIRHRSPVLVPFSCATLRKALRWVWQLLVVVPEVWRLVRASLFWFSSRMMVSLLLGSWGPEP